MYSNYASSISDITGLFAAAHLLKIGLLTAPSIQQFYVTYLASAFRSIRFGIKEAHGLGQCIQLNYILLQGGIIYDPITARFSVNFDTVATAVSNLTKDILILQGNGDKKRVKEFVDMYGEVRKEVKEALSKLEHEGIPIDIRPLYEIEKYVCL